MQNSTDANAPRTEQTFSFGPYVPILRPNKNIVIDPRGIVNEYSKNNPEVLNNRLIYEILPDDAIVEAPSLVTPLLLKKKTIWPPRANESSEPVTNQVDKQTSSENQLSGSTPNSNESEEDVQIVGVINRESSRNQNKRPIESYVKSTALARLTNKNTTNQSDSLLSIEDYYKSSAGQLLSGIGLSLAIEHNLESRARKVAKRSTNVGGHLIGELEKIKQELVKVKANNKPYNPTKVLKCPHCNFWSNFDIVLEGHLENPHIVGRDYSCNWCRFRTKDPGQIVFHNLYQHKKRCRIPEPPPKFNCHLCNFSVKSKTRLTRHLVTCGLEFPHHNFLGLLDPIDTEYPGITSKPITRKDIETYEQTLKALRLAAYNPHQIKVLNPRGNISPTFLVIPRPGGSMSNNSTTPQLQTPAASQNLVNNNNFVPNAFLHPANLLRNHQRVNTVVVQNPSPHLLELLSAQNINISQPRARVVNHPQPQSSFTNGTLLGKTASNLIMATSNLNDTIGFGDSPQNPSDETPNASYMSRPKPKTSNFVICEICDAYIKDLHHLKLHMHMSHKVKIHQKSLESRPPLSCQKCQWRFFTDQGLERHLLGSHSLVTSNMQESIDQGTDSGRCPLCGRSFATKLVQHMRDVHKSVLKPAYLTYKCTVCTATFNLYRLFENHVYSVHKESIKRNPTDP